MAHDALARDLMPAIKAVARVQPGRGENHIHCHTNDIRLSATAGQFEGLIIGYLVADIEFGTTVTVPELIREAPATLTSIAGQNADHRGRSQHHPLVRNTARAPTGKSC